MQKKIGFLIIALTSFIVTSCGCSMKKRSSNPDQSNSQVSTPSEDSQDVPISSSFDSSLDDSDNDHVHTYSASWSNDETYHWHAATCGHNVTSDKAFHEFGDWIITTDPTPTTEGLKYRNCSICGYAVYEKIPANGETHQHNFSNTWSFDETYHWHACSGCSEVKDKAEHVLGTPSIDINTGVISAGCLVCYHGVVLPPQACVITWKNYDGTVLETDTVYTGDTPTYDGPTPSKPSDSEYNYVFAGWTPDIRVVIESTSYTAKFNAVPISEQHEHNFVKNPDTLEYVCSCGEKNGRDYEMNITIPEIHVGDLYKPRDYAFSFKNDDGALVLGYVVFIVNGESTINPSKGTDYHFPETIVDEYITAIVYVGVHNDTNVKYLDDGNRIGNLDVYINNQLATQSVPHTNVTNPAWYPESEPSVIGGNFCAFRVSNLSKVLPSSTQPQTHTVIWKNYDGIVLRTDTDVTDPTHATYSGTEPTRPSDGQYTYYFKEWSLTSVSTDGYTIIYTATYEQSIFKFVYYNSSSYELYSLINKNYAGAIEVPATFMGLPVVQIDDDAFKDAKNVTSLIIPDSINNIGSHICAGMSSLQSLTVPFVGLNKNATGQDGVFGYFFGNTAATGLVETRQYYDSSNSRTSYIPESLRKVTVLDGNIGYGAFDNCSMLTNVAIKGAETIGKNAFLTCSSLSAISLNEGIKTIGDSAFAGTALIELVIPNSVTKLGNYICSGCTSLKTFLANNEEGKLIEIGWSFFNGCTSIETIALPLYGHLGTLFDDEMYDGAVEVVTDSGTYYIPSTLKTFKDTGGILSAKAFEYTPLTTIEITNQVLLINESALAGANSLVNLTIPYVGTNPEPTELDSSTLFGEIFGTHGYGNAYTNGVSQSPKVGNQKTYYLPNTLKNITVTGGNINYHAFQSVDKVDTITIKGATVIGEQAFYHCSANVTLNEGITTIEKQAFYYSDMASDLVIPDSVTSIGQSAFAYADHITGFVIGANVETIGGSAFSNCKVATSITFKGNKITTIESSTFNHCDALTSIVIPEGVTSIRSQAFDYCGALVDVTLPSTITDLRAASIFSHNDVLTSIKFNGTVAQWNAINKASNWVSSTCPNLATIRCSDGVVTL